MKASRVAPRVFLWALVLLLALPAGPTFAQGARPPVKIGVVNPLTGPAALYGVVAKKAAQMAADEVNARGGILGGRKLELVFEDDRVGSIRDIFCVPASELTKEQLAKEPLFASELSFEAPTMPAVKRDAALTAVRDAAVAAMRKMAADVERSPRAQKDLGDRTHAIGVKTGGGDFGLYVAKQRIRIEDALPAAADFVMVADDPQVFIRWVGDGSLTDAAVEGSLWLPNRAAFGVLPILDRLPRSVRRDVR